MPLLRRHAWLFIALAPIAALYFTWSWHGQIGSLLNDGITYLLMAQHYAHRGAADPGFAAAVLSQFPPLYPLLLAWLGAAADVHLAHALTTMFLLLGLACFYAWMQVERFSSAQAALLMMAFAALPGSWLTGLLIQSEYLYLLWSLLALALLSAYRNKQGDELLLAAGLAVAAAALTRTIGITLLLPLLLAALRAGRRAGVLALLSALLPLLLWHALHATQGNSYTESLRQHYGHQNLNLLPQQLGNMEQALDRGFAQNLLGDDRSSALADILGLLCLAASAWRAARRNPDGLYLAGYALVLLLWPFPGEAGRFLWVVMPVLLAQPILLIAELRRDPPHATLPQLATVGCAAVVMAMALPRISDAAERYRAAAYSVLPEAGGLQSWYTSVPAAATMRADAELSLIASLSRIPDAVPVGDCVISIRPDWINYYARRHSTYPPRDAVPDPYFGLQLRAAGCHYLFASRFVDTDFTAPLYPLRRIPEQYQVLDYVELSGMPQSQQPICELDRLR